MEGTGGKLHKSVQTTDKRKRRDAGHNLFAAEFRSFPVYFARNIMHYTLIISSVGFSKFLSFTSFSQRAKLKKKLYRLLKL